MLKLVSVLAVILGVWSHCEAGIWLTTPDEAQRKAIEQHKDLFLVFTGTAWCHPCVLFEEKILSRPEFAPGVEAMVAVKLEYPVADEQLPPDRREKYQSWRDRYGIRAYPTVILADPEGKPYLLTGFYSEDVADFVRKLGELRLVRDRRDVAFARAAKTQGLDKARALDEALSAMRDASDKTIAGQQGDTILRFYRSAIDELIASDPTNVAGLRERYQKLLGVDEEQNRLTQIQDRLGLAMKENGAKAALKMCDEELAREESADFRKKLVISKIYYLQSDQQYDAARALAEELAADSTRPAHERQMLRLRVAYNLMRLDRLDEAVAIHDKLITEVQDNPDASWRFRRYKADLLTPQRPAEAIQAWDAARPFVSSGSEAWLTTEILRVRLLGRVGRLDEAIHSLDLALAVPSLSELNRALILSDKVLILRKAGRRDEAVACADRADAILSKLATDENAETTKFIRSRLSVIRSDNSAK